MADLLTRHDDLSDRHPLCGQVDVRNLDIVGAEHANEATIRTTLSYLRHRTFGDRVHAIPAVCTEIQALVRSGAIATRRVARIGTEGLTAEVLLGDAPRMS